MSGTLSLVATPIGNLGDITLRGLETLREADLIACEDTRHTANLLRHYDIRKPLLSLHEHNEQSRIASILEKLELGSHIALVSDAGSPLISDPGFRLVRAVREAGHHLESLPGPCAAINALLLSGLPTDSFYFVGFLPPKSAARLRRFEELVDFPATLIFYESPHRIRKFLAEAYRVFGPRRFAIAREMTKKFEEIYHGHLTPKAEELALRSWKGEFVVLVAARSTGL